MNGPGAWRPRRTLGVLGLILLAGGGSGCAAINGVGKAATLNSLRGDLSDVAADTVVMPTSGIAEYEGIALLAGKDGVDAVAIAGDATLRADFSAGRVTGEVDDLVAMVTDTDLDITDLVTLVTNPLATLTNYDRAEGTVAITNGVITGSDLAADYAGTVTFDGVRYATSGTMDGQFSGGSGEMIEASASGANAAMTMDGAPMSSAGFYLIAGR